MILGAYLTPAVWLWPHEVDIGRMNLCCPQLRVNPSWGTWLNGALGVPWALVFFLHMYGCTGFCKYPQVGYLTLVHFKAYRVAF